MELLIERYSKKIKGLLKCFDRLVITGTIPLLSNSRSMTSYLYQHEIRIFDYPKFAEQFRDKLKANAEKIAKENGIEIEFVSKAKNRKEKIISEKIEKKGNQPGLVHILSAMEGCSTYKP